MSLSKAPHPESNTSTRNVIRGSVYGTVRAVATSSLLAKLPVAVRILFVSRPLFLTSRRDNRAVIRRRGCVGFLWVRE